MSIVLGLHYGHHGSVCVIRDGKLIGAISSERLSRHKFSHGVTNKDLDYLFGYLGITHNDIDYIGLSDWNKDFCFHQMEVFQGNEKIDCLWNRVYDNECLELDINFRGKNVKGYYIGHQLCHAASAFYTSPFEEAYSFSLDASGANNKNNSLIAYGKGKKLTSLHCPGLMIGVAYGYFTEYLGVGHQLFKAGSTMAVAAYGKVIPRVMDNLDSYVKACFYPDDQDYHQWYLNLWTDLHGSPEVFPWCQFDFEKGRDIAATIQLLFEQSILHCVRNIGPMTTKNLCLSGGSMLNCVTNSRILKETQFRNVHLFPGCGDDGGAVGSALYVAHHILGEERPEYSDSEICFLGPDKPMEGDINYGHIARKIAEGKVVAWCNGRAEFGPRALGNRSILADPRNHDNRERINSKIKNREWFRPLAPVILEKELNNWFDFDVKSPFMLFTAPVKRPDIIPEINHMDGSARIQTVNEETNFHYNRLVEEFNEITGVPILLNTSFNGNGEPMVESTQDAVNFFNLGTVDIMVLDGKIHER
jgi:carbamoyltransferase